MVKTRLAGHLMDEDLGDEDEVVAVRARTTEAKPAAEELAVRAATCSEVACLARWALVDGVGSEGLASLDVSGQTPEIGRWRRSLAQAVGVLLAGIGTVASAGRDLDDLADGAATIGGGLWRGTTVPWLLGVRW